MASGQMSSVKHIFSTNMSRSVIASICKQGGMVCACNNVRLLLWNRSIHTSGSVHKIKGPVRVELEDENGSTVDSEFTKLRIPGHNETPEDPRFGKKKQWMELKEFPPRHTSMQTDQDWTNAWPTASTFKWSAVPLPLRQGRVVGQENSGIPPGAYANLELMKIPNFLHLTPAHIKKHCAALKKLCTKWPEGLESDDLCSQHFPVEVITNDYVTDSVSVKDPRARSVTMEVSMSSMDLDYHARDKMIRMVGDRYDPQSGMLTLTMDRCPLRRQNYEYGIYLLTVLFKEAWKTESWESEKTLADMEKYVWNINPSKTTTADIISKMKLNESEAPEYVKAVSIDDLASAQPVKEYAEAVEVLHNQGEDTHTLNQYKQHVLKLLLKETPGHS